MTFPDRSGFLANWQAGKTQLVCTELVADTLTPVLAYLKLAQNEPYAFLLESVTGGEVLGRYSAIGFAPDLVWRCHKNAATLEDTASKTICETSNSPVAHLKDLVRAASLDAIPEGTPPMLASGWFGYLGYGMVSLVEPTVPDTRDDTTGIPDSVMIRPTIMAVFDNVRQVVHLGIPVRSHAGNSTENPDTVFEHTRETLNHLVQTLMYGHIEPTHTQTAGSAVPTPLPITPHWDEAGYLKAVEAAKADIAAGEIFQVVLAQRFSCPFDLPASDLYRALRRLNPSPFLVLMTLDGFSLIASSPEIMVRVRGGIVTIRPIAGTRRRGANPAEDKALAAELLADPKERAEHLMLLYLGRNDVAA